jgi:single-stranded DNA-binding protein
MSAIQIQQADAHLVDSPKLEYVTVGAEQRAKATFVAISNTVRGSGTQRREKATSIRWVAWGPAAEAHAQHLTRGSHINVTGRMSSFRYDEPESGRVVYGYDFVAEAVDYLDSKEAAQARRDRSSQRATGEPMNEHEPMAAQEPTRRARRSRKARTTA